MQQFSPELDQVEDGVYSPSKDSSPPGSYGKNMPLSAWISGFCATSVRVRAKSFMSPSRLLALKMEQLMVYILQSKRKMAHSLEVHFMGSHLALFRASLHPHSLPEYHHDGASKGVPSITASMNSGATEGIDDNHIHNVGLGRPNSHSFEINGGGPIFAGFSAAGNGSCSLHGLHYAWSNSNSYHHQPPSHTMWSNSPSFINSMQAHPQQMHGLHRMPSHLLHMPVALHHLQHHVGSAPAVNPSLWERQHAYSAEHMDASVFHPGSLGSMGFHGSSTLNPLEIASHNIFPHANGNCIDPSMTSQNVPSIHQRAHMFSSREPMIPLPASFDSSNERIRSRRNDANSNQADKKQYELDISRILCGEDTRTTLMIKNIPNKYAVLLYTSKMILATIDEHHQGKYDFIYLPIDFKNKCNVGYAFINMINPKYIVTFYQAFNGKKWEKFNSEKVASLAYARIQGKAALIAHFQNSSLMNEDKRCRPILFHSDGPNAGNQLGLNKTPVAQFPIQAWLKLNEACIMYNLVCRQRILGRVEFTSNNLLSQEPFPMGQNVRSRPGRTRSSNTEDSHQGSPPASANGDESSGGSDSSSDGYILLLICTVCSQNVRPTSNADMEPKPLYMFVPVKLNSVVVSVVVS
ncbi:hypothetical protein ACLOJK_019440 [Asimina triloba]